MSMRDWSKRTKLLYFGGVLMLLIGGYVSLSADEFLRRSVGIALVLGAVWLVRASAEERRRSRFK